MIKSMIAIIFLSIGFMVFLSGNVFPSLVIVLISIVIALDNRS